MIQIKNVPPEVHEELRRRADQERLTIRDYMLRLIERDQQLPSRKDWLERVGRLRVATSQSAAELIRAGREERDRELMSRIESHDDARGR